MFESYPRMPTSGRGGAQAVFTTRSGSGRGGVVDRTFVAVLIGACGLCRSRTFTARAREASVPRWTDWARNIVPRAMRSSSSSRGTPHSDNSCSRA